MKPALASCPIEGILLRAPEIVHWSLWVADERGAYALDREAPMEPPRIPTTHSASRGGRPAEASLWLRRTPVTSSATQLGDGRALVLGEVVDRSGRQSDIQLEGSGPTPFSRGGDGRAPLGPVLREYLIAEAMHALGIPCQSPLPETGISTFLRQSSHTMFRSSLSGCKSASFTGS